MLAELEIENFALVERACLSFSEGLNILTGETGAGKSLIVDAMDFLLGGAPREKPLRAGADRGSVSGRFTDLPAEARTLLGEWGLDEGDEVLLARELHASGRSSGRINSRLATVAQLRDLGAVMMDLHGQHQHYSLLRPSRHLGILDRFAGEPQAALLQDYSGAYRRARDLQAELDQLRGQERERLREIDWAEHELGEIEAVQPRLGEDLELEQEIRVLAAAEDLSRGAMEAHARLEEEGGASEALARAGRVLQGLLAHDSRLESLAERLEEAAVLAGDTARELRSYAEGIQADPARLEELQGREESLRRLQRKYGPSLEEVLAYRDRTRVRLEELKGASARSETLESDLAEALALRTRSAERLGAARREAAARLEAEVGQELARVGMEACRFVVDLAAADSPGPEGADRVEFLIAPNPGEPPRPLARIASGGELSRIMLALLSLFSRFEPVPTLLFDEIDAGLGGRAAEAVARRLADLAERCQVLCVTHLAVLAATGACHHHLHKQVQDGRTATSARRLEGEEREIELARMLSGDASPETARSHARELLARANT